jgi:hypothetical protein
LYGSAFGCSIEGNGYREEGQKRRDEENKKVAGKRIDVRLCCITCVDSSVVS